MWDSLYSLAFLILKICLFSAVEKILFILYQKIVYVINLNDYLVDVFYIFINCNLIF